MIKIVNCKKERYDIYIGRTKKKFHYGNPFADTTTSLASVKVVDRKTAIEEYRNWLFGKKWTFLEQERRRWIIGNLYKLKDKTLGCFCRPEKECHGDVLKDIVDNDIKTDHIIKLPNGQGFLDGDHWVHPDDFQGSDFD